LGVKMDHVQRAKQFEAFDALSGLSEAVHAKEAPKVNMTDQIPVPVIVSFSKDGGMVPLYFSVNGIRIKVDNICWKNENKTWGSRYRCEITLSDRVETVDLYYYNVERIWTMGKK